MCHSREHRPKTYRCAVQHTYKRIVYYCQANKIPYVLPRLAHQKDHLAYAFPWWPILSLTCNTVNDEVCRAFSHPQRTVLIIFWAVTLFASGLNTWPPYELCTMHTRQLKASATGRPFSQTSPTVSSLEKLMKAKSVAMFFIHLHALNRVFLIQRIRISQWFLLDEASKMWSIVLHSRIWNFEITRLAEASLEFPAFRVWSLC